MVECPLCQEFGSVTCRSDIVNINCDVCKQLGIYHTFIECSHSLCPDCISKTTRNGRTIKYINKQFNMCHICKEVKDIYQNTKYGTYECSICNDIKPDIKLIDNNYSACTECFSNIISGYKKIIYKIYIIYKDVMN